MSLLNCSLEKTKKHILFAALILLSMCCFAQSEQIDHNEYGRVWIENTVQGFKGATTKQGETIIPISQKYDEIKYLPGEGWWFVVKRKGSVGIWHSDGHGEGKEVISLDEHYEMIKVLRYKYLEFGEPCVFKVFKDGKEGVVDDTGTPIIPLNKGYHNIIKTGYSCEGDYIVEKDKFMGVCSFDGKEVIPISRKYTFIEKEEEGFFSVTRDCDTGFCTRQGREIIPPDGTYSHVKITRYLENYIISGVKNNHFYSFDTEGDTIIKINLTESSVHTSNYGYQVKTGDIATFYDKTGHLIIPSERGYSEIVLQSYLKFSTMVRYMGINCFIVQKNGYYGACDENGNEVISPDRKYTKIVFSDKKQRRYNVWKNGFQGICDEKGVEVIPISRQFTNITLAENLDRVYFITEKGDHQGIFNDKWKELITPEKGYTKAYFDADYIYVIKSNCVGLCDSSGYPIINIDRGYSTVTPALFGTLHYYYITKNGLMGICDNKGQEVVPPKYNKLSVFSQGFKNWDENKKEWEEIGVAIEGDSFIFYDPNSMAKYEEYYQEGNRLFSEKKYNQAASNFKKALKYKESFYLYYNIGVSYYNSKSYSKAISYFDQCITSKAPDNIYNDAVRLKRSAQSILDRKKEKRQEILAAVLLGAAAAMNQASMSIPSPNISSYNINQVQNQIMQQTLQQTNYDMMMQQQWRQNIEKHAKQSYESFVRQQEMQNQAEYEAFTRNMKKMDGSDYSYDEWMQIKINTYYQSQNESSQSATENSSNPIQPHQVTKSCPLCHGTGKCPSCNGTHRINYEFGSGTLECPNCNPDGKCTSCGGSGTSTSTKYY